MVWVKGQSGNTSGSNKRQKRFGPALERAIKAAQKQNGTDALDEIAARLINEALTSDNPLPAIKEIADRLDGKPAQAIVGDNELDPVRISNYKEDSESLIKRFMANYGAKDAK